MWIHLLLSTNRLCAIFPPGSRLLRDKRNTHGKDLLLDGEAPKIGQKMRNPKLANVLKVGFQFRLFRLLGALVLLTKGEEISSSGLPYQDLHHLNFTQNSSPLSPSSHNSTLLKSLVWSFEEFGFLPLARGLLAECRVFISDIGHAR